MPTQHAIRQEPKDDGSTREKLEVEFSNGSLEQLRDLAVYFKVPNNDPYEAVMFAIGVLEKIKEDNAKKHSDI